MDGSPELFKLGPLTFYTLGTTIASGFLLVSIMSIPNARRLGLGRLRLLGAMIWVMAFSILGGRLVAVWPVKEYYIKNLGEFFLIPEDGISFIGAITFGLLSLMLYTLINEIPFWLMLDCIAPSIVTSLVLGTAYLFPPPASGGIVLYTIYQWLLLSGAYVVTYVIWKRRRYTRFIGEISLMLFLALGAFLVILSVLFNMTQSLSGWIILGISTILWFYRKGVSLRVPNQLWRFQYPYRQMPYAWIIGYVIIFLTLFL